MGIVRNKVGTPTTPQILELKQFGTVPTTPSGVKPIIQVYHFYQVAIVPIAEDLPSLLASFDGQMAATLGAALNVDYTGQKYTGRYMDDPTSPEITAAAVPPNGTRTGDRLPLFNAATIRLLSSNRGRSYNGSKHFAPVSESDTTDDTITGTGLTNWTAVEAVLATPLLLSGANGSAWELIVLSTILSNLTANPSVFTFSTLTPARAAALNAKIGWMRRRKSKG